MTSDATGSACGDKAQLGFAHLWALRPDVAYLNHGSFGACPSALLAYQQSLRGELEREPTDFLARELSGRLAAARRSLAGFIGANPDDLAFTFNATTAINAVVRSLDFAPGDELLTTDHAYGACRKTLEYVANRTGAHVVAANVPFPLRDENEIVAPILAAVTYKTRLALIDHVTSPTALVFPIARIVRELRERGVETLVDGAHAVGMIPLHLDELGAAYYTSNAHKWLCAPKGAAFLHVRRDLQRAIHPATISHGYDPSLGGIARFREEFDWIGSIDPTAWLTIPECLRYLESLLPGGWNEVMRRNHSLALSARRTVCKQLGVEAPCPDTMVGAMASIPLPTAQRGSPIDRLDHEQVMLWFRERGVETWLFPWDCAGKKLIRLSAQLYNSDVEFSQLSQMLVEALQ